MLLDVFGKMCVSDALHGRVASIPLLIILKRFADDSSVIEFVEQYAKLALTLFINVERKQTEKATYVSVNGRVDRVLRESQPVSLEWSMEQGIDCNGGVCVSCELGASRWMPGRSGAR